MTWGRKSRLGVCAFAAAAVAMAGAGSAAAAPPGVDEYDLNIPNAGGESTEPAAPAPTPTAPAPTTTPVYPTDTTTEAPIVPAEPEKPEHHRAIVRGDTSVNAKLGPQQPQPLKLRDSDGDGVPWTTIGLAALIAICCLVAIWRLRYRRELPAASRPRPEAGRQPRRGPAAAPHRPATGATSGS